MSSISIKFHKNPLQWNCCPDRSRVQATPLPCSMKQGSLFYCSVLLFSNLFSKVILLFVWIFISLRPYPHHDFWTYWPNLDKTDKRTEAGKVLNSCELDEKRWQGKEILLLKESLKGYDLTIRYSSPTSNQPLLGNKACFQYSWTTFLPEQGNVHMSFSERL